MRYVVCAEVTPLRANDYNLIVEYNAWWNNVFYAKLEAARSQEAALKIAQKEAHEAFGTSVADFNKVYYSNDVDVEVKKNRGGIIFRMHLVIRKLWDAALRKEARQLEGMYAMVNILHPVTNQLLIPEGKKIGAKDSYIIYEQGLEPRSLIRNGYIGKNKFKVIK